MHFTWRTTLTIWQMYKKQQITTQSAEVFLKEFTEFQIPWDMSDPESEV